MKKKDCCCCLEEKCQPEARTGYVREGRAKIRGPNRGEREEERERKWWGLGRLPETERVGNIEKIGNGKE